MNTSRKKGKELPVNELYTSYMMNLENTNCSHVQDPHTIECAQKKIWNIIEPKVEYLCEDSTRKNPFSFRVYIKNTGLILAGGAFMWAILSLLYPQQNSSAAVADLDIEFSERTIQELRPMPIVDESIRFELPLETEFTITGRPVLYSR